MLTPTIAPVIIGEEIGGHKIEVTAWATPYPGVEAGQGTDEWLFLLTPTKRGYTSRIKKWLDDHYGVGAYKYRGCWMPEPRVEQDDEF